MDQPVRRPIVRLGAPGVDPAALGGKGASLHQLAALGLRVPPGLCVTTAAFRAQRSGLPASDDPATAVLAAPIIAEVADALEAELGDLLAELGPGWEQPRFAVRSSAVGEDGSMASYAGLHDTELDVAAEDVAAAVRRCWASLWSPAAIAYRRQRGLEDDDAAMAVVVQVLVRADASAIAFTRHPVTHREDQILITATRGLGDAMASGTVTPDTLIVDRASHAVVEAVVEDPVAGPALDAAEVDELVSLCLEVEAHLGGPLDVEAAIRGGTWYLLQARPVTTGQPADGADGDDASASGTAFPVAFDDPDDASFTWEWDDMHMPFALPPLASEYATRTIGSGMNRAYERFGEPRRLQAIAFNGYVYFSMRRNVDEDELEAADARWLAIRREQIGLIEAYWTDEALPDIQRYAGWMAGLGVSGLAPEAAVATWRAAWAETERLWGIHFVAIRGPYQVMEDLAEAFAVAVGPGRDVDALALIGGGRHELETVDEALEGLAALADEVRGLDGALDAARRSPEGAWEAESAAWLDGLRDLPGGEPFVVALATFLGQHGHLGHTHDDLRQPSWAEDPRLIVDHLLRRSGGHVPPAAQRLAAKQRRADELADEARAALADRDDDLDRFERLLADARRVGYLTEGHNYWIDRLAQARLRALVLRFGRRLAGDGVLADPGDIFFLSGDEVVEAVVDGLPRQALVDDRRAALEAWDRLTPPPTVGKAAEELETSRFGGVSYRTDDPKLLRGTGASAGIARGPARLVRSPHDFGRVQSGDIIVCPSANPSWVPVFLVAGGLVTNTGGVLAHAAVVAREFALPAVVGVANATSLIADGLEIEIDGTSGTVHLP